MFSAILLMLVWMLNTQRILPYFFLKRSGYFSFRQILLFAQCNQLPLKEFSSLTTSSLLQEYHARLSEDARWPKTVLTVTATDADTEEHGQVTYTLGGEGALMFVVNETTGEVGGSWRSVNS